MGLQGGGQEADHMPVLKFQANHSAPITDFTAKMSCKSEVCGRLNIERVNK
jgi:hypothetical protein